jgi:hypothetical protein
MTGRWGRDEISRESGTRSERPRRSGPFGLAGQHVEQHERDPQDQRHGSNDQQDVTRRGRPRFHYPHGVWLDPVPDLLVERNVGVLDAAVSSDHRPNSAFAPFEHRNPSEPPEPTSADVSQVGGGDTGRTATTASTADAHMCKVVGATE